MATTLQRIIDRARVTLLERAAAYWGDDELLTHANSAIKDLWASILDLYQDHLVTMDTTNVSIAASTSALTGVPADVFRILMVQPRTLGQSSSNQGLVFQPRTLLSPDFVQAQACRPVDPKNQVVYYCVINAGAPVGAPSIIIAPQLSSAVNLALWYNPTIPTKGATDTNPIPGESDKAVEEYVIAFARAKEREDRAPDPEHLSIYATEKRKLLTVLTPRSIQEPETVDAFWQDYSPYGQLQ